MIALTTQSISELKKTINLELTAKKIVNSRGSFQLWKKSCVIYFPCFVSFSHQHHQHHQRHHSHQHHDQLHLWQYHCLVSPQLHLWFARFQENISSLFNIAFELWNLFANLKYWRWIKSCVTSFLNTSPNQHSLPLFWLLWGF